MTVGWGTGKKTGHLTRRGNEEEFSPTPAPVRNGAGEFSPLRGRAPTGSGNPRPFAISSHTISKRNKGKKAREKE